MAWMQEAGVAAGLVENAEDIFADRQLRERGFFQMLNHPEIGAMRHPGQPAKLSKTPAELNMPGPCLGEHTEYVCTSLLGMSDEDFVRLHKEGVFR